MIRIRTNFNWVLLIIFLIIFAVGVIVGMVKYFWSVEQHKLEIHRMIEEKGGGVVEINKNEGPFKDKIKSANTVYEVIYEKEGNRYIAWFRTTRGAIHVDRDSKNEFRDEWIWQNEPLE